MNRLTIDQLLRLNEYYVSLFEKHPTYEAGEVFYRLSEIIAGRFRERWESRRLIDNKDT